MAERITRRTLLQSAGAGLVFFAGAPVRVKPAPDGTFTVYTGKVELGQGSRTELTQAVAEELRVPVSKITLVMGDTTLCPDDGGTYGSLTTPLNVPVFRKAAADQRGAPLTAPGEWKVLGTSTPDVRGRAIVTGRLEYPSDVHAEGMLHARVARPPAYHAKLISAEGAAAVRDGELVAAVAPNPVAAQASLRSIKTRWEPASFPVELSDRDALAAYFKANSTPPTEQPGTRYPPLMRRGDPAGALNGAARKQSSQYWLPYIAHTPMEPRAALAAWKGDEVEIHTGTQTPFPLRAEVARALEVPESKVRIITVGPGGAFGGKQRGECEIEAARLARIAGAPVKVAWTREEEFTCAYHRPAGVIEIESAAGPDGRLEAWIHRNYNAGAPGLPTPYDTPNVSCEFHRSPSPVRQGSYRALAATSNVFARESHMDEWASTLKIDPVEFRLRNLAEDRLRAVLEKLGKGPGGVACAIEKDGRIALRAEVAVVGKVIRLKRFTFAGDFGAVLNPGNLRNQITGALIMGIGGALFEEVLFDANAQTTRRLSRYRVPRFTDIPEIEIRLIDRRDMPSAGAGEAPITLVAPAIANAVFLLTGKRLRSLPLTL